VGAGIESGAFSLEPLLELVARHEAEGQGDAPWPPHYAKADGEPPRVQPSKRRTRPAEGAPTDPDAPRGRAGSAAPAMPSPPARRADGTVSPTGRRRSSAPLRVVSQAATREEALAGLDRWRERWPAASAHVGEEEVLVDGMRGRSSLWYRVRVNLRNVPEADRPPDEKPDPDYDPWAAYRDG
jgi:hypothetical protein